MDDIIARIGSLLANTPQSEVDEFEVTRCLRDAKDELIAARACAEMMLQGTGQPIAERMAERVLSDIASTFAGVPQWIPVSERLPEENVQVLAYSPDDDDGDLHVCSWGVERKPFMEPRGYFSRLDFKTIWGVTHWMPLPSPPAE